MLHVLCIFHTVINYINMILYPKARSMLDQQFIPGPLKILVWPCCLFSQGEFLIKKYEITHIFQA